MLIWWINFYIAYEERPTACLSRWTNFGNSDKTNTPPTVPPPDLRFLILSSDYKRKRLVDRFSRITVNSKEGDTVPRQSSAVLPQLLQLPSAPTPVVVTVVTETSTTQVSIRVSLECPLPVIAMMWYNCHAVVAHTIFSTIALIQL
jgi:hypothetical protein